MSIPISAGVGLEGRVGEQMMMGWTDGRDGDRKKVNGTRAVVVLGGGTDQRWLDGREGMVCVEWRNMADG